MRIKKKKKYLRNYNSNFIHSREHNISRMLYGNVCKSGTNIHLDWSDFSGQRSVCDLTEHVFGR